MNRRWFQFSVRGLLVMTLLCALTIAVPWWRHIRAFRLEQQALTDLQPFLSREVMTEPRGPTYLETVFGEKCRQRVVNLYLSGDDMLDTDLAKIRQFSHLEILMLENCPRISEGGLARGIRGATAQNLAMTNVPITNTVLQEVRELPNLQMLQLHSDDMTDEALAPLNGMNGLKVLWLYAPNVSDEGLTHLRNLTGLNHLSLNCLGVTDEGLTHLENLTGLSDLSLDCPGVTDEGLVHLSRLTNLIRLGIYCPRVTDDGLVHLNHLVRLERLVLRCSVTDAGMPHLVTLKNLQRLICNNPSIRSTDPNPRSMDAYCRFTDAPLTDVVAYLSAQQSIPIRFDDKALAEAEIEAAKITVTLDKRGVMLDECLQALLHPYGLNYLVEQDALEITTQDVTPVVEREVDKLSRSLPKLKSLDVNW